MHVAEHAVRTLVVALVTLAAVSCSGEAPRRARATRAADGGVEHDAGTRDGAEPAACGEREPAPARQPPAVEGSGVHGSIAALPPTDRRAFCDWLWRLPDYGAHYCCPGVLRPLRIAVQTESDRERCLDDLAIFEKCPEVQVDAYEACAVAKLSRYCGTPLGCDALSNQGQTSICLAR